MSTRPIPDFLAKKNVHERDQFITFDEGPHVYTVHGDSTFTSVTTWIHSLFPTFDADKIIDGMMTGKKMRDPSYKYYGMTKQEIKALWGSKGTEASCAGTNMHYDIECYYNYMEVENNSVEFDYFLKFDADFPDLIPFRTEWMVYYEELKLSGSIDMIFEKPNGELEIYDWKRCEEIPHESFGNKTAIASCISHVPDSKFWHYAIQLNTYRAIIQAKYGKKVTALYLVRLHPGTLTKTYDRIPVPILEKEIDDLFALRRQQVLDGTDQIKKH